MPKFGKKSILEFSTLHPDLKLVLGEAIKCCDFAVLEGFRDKDKQDRDFATGFSKLKFPLSKHNKKPSEAVDIAPFPIDLYDTRRFIYYAGIIKGIAEILRQQGKINSFIRWGGDWNRNNNPSDENFLDFGHFEIDDNPIIY